MAKFQIYKDNASNYRWRLRANNNEIVAISSESYETKTGCKNSIQWVKTNAPDASTEDETE